MRGCQFYTVQNLAAWPSGKNVVLVILGSLAAWVQTQSQTSHCFFEQETTLIAQY